MEAPTSSKKFAGRYEIRQVLGQGGMGVVYRAHDTVIRRDVALKTILDVLDPTSLQLFYKECNVLAAMSHPNIVEIFDIGEFEDEDRKKPYFVMPLLPGTTLESFIRNASHRLTVERTIDIMTQTCRGLQAAHERGLIHRDLKPSNIFVMEDDSVKIIDFGVAHMTDTKSTRGQKGTLVYMSPEQIEMKPLSAVSDIFSLSVVCYEALTGRQPFQRARGDEIVDAILHHIPPAASDINPTVSQLISRVVHKGMAKQPWNRFSSAREFADMLHRALRNEPIEFFDPARTRPRLQRASKAFEEGDFQFAAEILGELEAEGHIDPDIGSLRHQLDMAVRQKTITQLLDAAKARFEEEEHPLALQKLQEVLQMEPDHAAALTLKSRIENQRSEKQIENWYRLARQHMENHSYAHAREALQNVLQLRPRETQAVQLIAEVDREEQQYNKVRQEKAQLHRAAMDAWQKGDVSGALTKLAVVLELDRRAPDSSNPERSAAYQGFYNQVRSEHDAMNTAYAEARKHLVEHNFEKALAVCDTYLAKYPNNAIFQALKYDVEEQDRQEQSAFIASVDRRVEAEPDLDKRVHILKEALNLHPGEAHFERALRLVQDKRDLVNSIVTRAHFHEEQGAFSDALNDWEILRTIYGQYPGLKFEVERLQKRREQQSRIEAKSRAVEQIDACIHSANYTRAMELVEEAKPEFPNDDELVELEKLAREGMQRADEAQRLMTEGQDLCTQDRFADGVALLQKAYELDEHNPLTRAVLSNALVERARVVVESNWQEAEELARQAFSLNPEHPLARTLRTLILDHKREQSVNRCLSQARKLQATDPAGAMAQVEQGLSAYPHEPRLIQIRETLQREFQTQLRQTRRRDLDELRQIERELDSGVDESKKEEFVARIQALAGKYSDDREILAATSNLEQRLTGAAAKVASAPAAIPRSSVPGSADRTMSSYSPATLGHASAAESETFAAPAPAPARAPVAAPKPIPKPEQPLPAPQAPPPRNLLPLIAVTAGVLLLVVASLYWLKHRSGTAAGSAAAFTATIHTTPPGATIRINNEERGTSDLQVALPQGTYQVQAELDGYQTASTSLELKPGGVNSADLDLQPAPVLLRVSADTGAGKVWLDERPAGELEGTQWTLDKLPAGEHTMKFAGPQGRASFSFTTGPATLPVVNQTPSVDGVLAVIVASMGSRLRVYCSDPAAKLSLDGQTAVDAGELGLDLPRIPKGVHQLTVTHGSDQYKVDVEVSTASALTTFLESGQNIGTLLVVTREDRVRVFVNGQLQKQTTQGGQLQIAGLEPKDYTVRVSKNGFQEVAEQKVHIRKGEQSTVSFELRPSPRLASLSIRGGIPGTEVLIDKSSVGTVQPDGTLTVSNVNPGDHVIELQKDRYKAKHLQKRFAAGASVALAASEAALDAALGELRITFSPPDAAVTIARAGESPTKVSSGSALNLPAGSYSIVARTADGLVRTSQVEVAAGESRKIDLPLAPTGMSKWENPTSWKSEKGWFVHRGAGFVLYSASPTSGTFIFTASLLKGHRIEWVLNYQDANNYGLFQMDDNYFYRSIVRNGQKIDAVKVPHKMEKKAPVTLQIRVTPNEVVHQVRDKDSWVALDTWSQPGTNLSLGKFGFLFVGNDQLAVSNFNHYADLSAH